MQKELNHQWVHSLRTPKMTVLKYVLNATHTPLPPFSHLKSVRF